MPNEDVSKAFAELVTKEFMKLVKAEKERSVKFYNLRAIQKATGIDKSRIGQLLNGKQRSPLNVPEMISLARLFKIPVASLFFGGESLSVDEWRVIISYREVKQEGDYDIPAVFEEWVRIIKEERS